MKNTKNKNNLSLIGRLHISHMALEHIKSIGCLHIQILKSIGRLHINHTQKYRLSSHIIHMALEHIKSCNSVNFHHIDMGGSKVSMDLGPLDGGQANVDSGQPNIT